MSKKKGKSKKGGSPRKNNGGGKFDLMGTLMDKDVLMGAAIGLGLGGVIEAIGKSYIKNDMIRSGVESVAPALVAGFLLKNKNATIAAAGAGAAVGFGAQVIKMITDVTEKKPAAEANTGVKGLPYGEDIYGQIQGDIAYVRGANGTFYPVQQPAAQVNGNDDLEPVNGEELEPVTGELSGQDDDMSVSGELDSLS